MVDIYNRLATDLNYEPAIETNDEIEAILQLVKMILGTNPGDILGQPYFGINIKKYIFSLSFNKTELNNLVKEAIITNTYYDLTKYDLGIDVQYGKEYTGGYDYAVINISINLKRYLGIMMTQ